MKEDLIKRSDAIKELGREYPAMPMFKSLREEWAIKTEGYRKAEEVIMRLPSADRPRGEWIEIDDYFIRCKCSICGWESHKYEDDVYCMPYCPNCGTNMRKGVSNE